MKISPSQIDVKEGVCEIWLKSFFLEINKTSMKRPDFELFKRAYLSRDVVISLWQGEMLLGFGSMLTDWVMNSIIYDVVVENFRRQNLGKMIMDALMAKAPTTRFYLTATFGHEEFYRKLGFRKHKTAFALYPSDSPFLE